MNPIQYQIARGVNSSGTEEVEVLQTDVMRFMAILGFCLMIIFALVQSLPAVPQDLQPTLINREIQDREIEEMEVHLSHLRRELVDLEQEVKSAKEQSERSSLSTKIAHRNEQEALDRAEKANQEFARLSQSLAAAKEEMDRREEKLLSIKVDIAKGTKDLSKVRGDLKREEKQLGILEAELDRASKRFSELKRSPKEKDQKPVPPTPSPPREKKDVGYTLRFESDRALETLLKSERVRLFAMVGKKTWAFKATKGRSLFITSERPTRFHVMESRTVPPDYGKVLSRAVVAFGRESVTWGVTLPTEISLSLSKQMKNHRGGELIINQKGSVALK